MLTGRHWCVGTVANNQMIVVGGSYLSSIEAYDPATHRWTNLPNMKGTRLGPGAVTLENQVSVVGGRGARGDDFCSVETFDFKTQTWTHLPSMRTRRWSCAAAVIDDHIIVVGGYDSVVLPAQNYTTRLLVSGIASLPCRRCVMNVLLLWLAGRSLYSVALATKLPRCLTWTPTKWSGLPSMSKVRCGSVAVAAGNLIL